MTPIETRLLIPATAVDGWAWLDAALARAAEKAGVSVQSEKATGPYRCYRYSQLSAAELKPLADYALLRGGEGVWAQISDDDEITVRLGLQWLRPMGTHQPTFENTHPYYVAFSELCKILSWDEQYKAWWATSGYLQFNFHQTPGEPDGPWEWSERDEGSWIYVRVPLDLSILSVKDSTQEDMDRQAAANVRVVVERIARELHMAPPPFDRGAGLMTASN